MTIQEVISEGIARAKKLHPYGMPANLETWFDRWLKESLKMEKTEEQMIIEAKELLSHARFLRSKNPSPEEMAHRELSMNQPIGKTVTHFLNNERIFPKWIIRDCDRGTPQYNNLIKAITLIVSNYGEDVLTKDMSLKECINIVKNAIGNSLPLICITRNRNGKYYNLFKYYPSFSFQNKHSQKSVRLNTTRNCYYFIEEDMCLHVVDVLYSNYFFWSNKDGRCYKEYVPYIFDGRELHLSNDMKFIKAVNKATGRGNPIYQGDPIPASDTRLDNPEQWNSWLEGETYHRCSSQSVCNCCGETFSTYKGVIIEGRGLHFCYKCWRLIHPKTGNGRPPISIPMGGASRK